MSDVNFTVGAIDETAAVLNKVSGQIDALPKDIADANQKIKTDTEKTATSFKDAWKDNIKIVAGVFGTLTAAVLAAKKVFEFSEEGAQLMRLEQAGDNLAASYGANMDVIVSKIKTASLNTVAETDIILGGNRAMMLGLGSDADQLANLMEVAAFRGRAMGLSTTQAFNDIVTGVGRMSPMILDNLGIVIDANKRYEEYAEGLGIATSEIDAATKRQILLNGVLEEGNRQLEEAGGLAYDTAAAYEEAGARTTDYFNRLKKGSGETFEPVINKYNQQLEYIELIDKAQKSGLITKWQEFDMSMKLAYGNVQYADAIAEVNELLGQQPGYYAAVGESAVENFYAARAQIQGAKEDFEDLALSEDAAKSALSELSLMMKTDLSGSYEDVIDKKQTLITKIEKLQTEINTLSGDYDTNRKKIFDLTEEMEKTYLEIEKVSEAWELQAKKMVFSLAEQRLAMDGWTNEELIALGKLAGPEGLGLVDEAWAALIGKIGEASTVMDAQGDQSNEFVGILNNVAGALGDASGEASRLRDNINSIQSRTVSVTTNYYSANYSTGAPRSYGGPRATGGPVDPSHYYSVAERESEVFVPSSGGSDALFLPKEPGKIVPASQMGGEGGVGGDLVIHTLNINNGMDVNEFDAMARSWFNG